MSWCCSLKFLSCNDYVPYMNKLRRVTVLRRRRGRNWRRAWAVTVASSLAAAVSLAAAPMADAATTSSAGRPLRGIDISAYQHADGPVNWRLLARHGIRFVAIKVTEGTYYTNPYYWSDDRGAARAGLAVMPYVFANPGAAGGAATASFALRAARYRRGSAVLPLVVDLENDPYSRSNCYWLGSRRMVAWIAGFTTRTRALTGVWPIIYTTDAWWKQCTRSTGRFGADPLWLADYNAAGRVRRAPGVGGRSGSTPTKASFPGSAGPTSTTTNRLPTSDRSARQPGQNQATSASRGTSGSRRTSRSRSTCGKTRMSIGPSRRGRAGLRTSASTSQRRNAKKG